MAPSGVELAAMRRAVALSAFGVGSTSPNPAVGCIVLDRAGRAVGEGYHLRKGEQHAEVGALSAAGADARGGTAVVTLELCNHLGRTPPCRQALLDAAIARVLVAVIDPTSHGEGGVAALRAQGIEVETGVLADDARLVLGPSFRLRTAHPQEPAREQLASLYEGGVRTLLLDLVPAAADLYLVAGLVDRVVELVQDIPPSRRLGMVDGRGVLTMPSGFILTAVSRGPGHVLLHGAAPE